MASSSILSVPFRRTTAVELSSVLSQYIASQYGQHPNTFKEELTTIGRLRRDAVNVQEAHVSGIEKLYSYCAQLSYLLGKCPTDIGANFCWFPALGYSTEKAIEEDDLRFELASCLFNLISLYSQLGVAANASTDAGLKAGANYFSNAAGIARHLHEKVVPDLRRAAEDLDRMTLQTLELLMLAQAQECFWLKAVFNGLKDATVAKLAARVSDLYIEARDGAVCSNSISAEWIHHMTAKHFHFAAAAHFRAAGDCLERRKYGEEVAQLSACVRTIDQALKEKRWVNRSVLSDMQGLKQKAAEDLKRASKDNDMIYVNPVPPQAELKTIDRVSLAKPVLAKEVSDPIGLLTSGKSRLGKPLFQKLVPFAVHAAASIYAERRDRIVNTRLIARYEELTDSLRALLQSLNLPASLQALEKPLGIPNAVIDHAEEIRAQDGIDRLQSSVRTVTKLKHRGQFLYDEAVEIMREEEAEDQELAYKYGTDRWTRANSRVAGQKLYQQATEYKSYMDSADASDQLVVTKIDESAPIIELYSGSNKALQEFLPSTTSAKSSHSNVSRREVSALRAVLDEIDTLDRKRKREVERLRHRASTDDVNDALLNEAARLEREYPTNRLEPAQFEHLFETRLRHAYDADEARLDADAASQPALEQRLRTANDAFVRSRAGETQAGARERRLAELEVGYGKYVEIVRGLEGGLKFYDNLGTLLERFRDQAGGFAQNRRLEARNLEAEIGNLAEMRRLRLEPRGEGEDGRGQVEQQGQWHGQQQQQQQQQQQSWANRGEHGGAAAVTVHSVSGKATEGRPQPRSEQPRITPSETMPGGFAASKPLQAPLQPQRQPTLPIHAPQPQPKMAYPTGNLPSIAAGIWTPDRPIVFGGGSLPLPAGSGDGGSGPLMNSGRARETTTTTTWNQGQALRFG